MAAVPDVPLIQPKAEAGGLPPGPRLDPGEFASLSTFGLRIASREAGRIASVAEDYVRIKRTLDEESDKLAADKAANVYKLNVTDTMNKVSQDTSITPEQYAPAVEDASRKARESIGKTLTTARSRDLFERQADNIYTNTAITARSEGLKLQLAGIKSAHGDKLQGMSTAAVMIPLAPVGDVEAANQTAAAVEAQMTTIYAEIDEKTRLGIYTGGEARAEKLRQARVVSFGRIKREWQDPVRRPEILSRLAEGQAHGIDADDQLVLRDQLQNQQRIDEEREEARQDRDRTKRGDAGLKDVTDFWYGNKRHEGLARLAELRNDLPSGVYDKWVERLQADPVPPETPNDPATLERLQKRVYSVDNVAHPPRQVLEEVHEALTNHKLNPAAHRVLANETQNRILQLQAKAERDAERADRQRDRVEQRDLFAYRQVDRQLTQLFRETGDLKFDSASQAVLGDALEDFFESTNPYNKQRAMTPEQWWARRSPVYAARMSERADHRLNEITDKLVSVGAVPAGFSVKSPVVAQNAINYLYVNRDAIEKRHGSHEWGLIMQSARDAQTMLREQQRQRDILERNRIIQGRESGGGGGGGGGTAPTPAGPRPQGTAAPNPALAGPKSGGR
jgi:hypothetical protein